MNLNTIIKENPSAPPKRSLTAHDRCDACGAQAWVRVQFSKGALCFCAHHMNKFETRLRSIAVSVVDERTVLDELESLH